MPFIGDVLQNTANTLHSWGVNTPEMGWTEAAGNTGGTQPVSYKLPGTDKTIWSNGNLKGEQTFYDKVYNFDGPEIRYIRDAPKTTSTKPTQNGTSQDNSQINGGSAYGYYSGGSTAPQYSAADERAAYDDQISALDRLLGYANTQRDAGLRSLDDKYNFEKKTLDDQYARANSGYDLKTAENAQAREKGYGEVDRYANDTYRNLQRLLQGANAGSSSVARELIPYLVSKGATTRRTGVTETAGKNDQAIKSARDDAEYQYGINTQDLKNNDANSRKAFLDSILNQQNTLDAQKADLITKRAMANGQGYAAARAAATSVQNGINDRQNQLASLFGQYKPTYTAKAMNTKTPDLSQFTVDKAAINNSNSNLPAESSFYQTQLKKKQQLGN